MLFFMWCGVVCVCLFSCSFLIVHFPPFFQAFSDNLCYWFDIRMDWKNISYFDSYHKYNPLFTNHYPGVSLETVFTATYAATYEGAVDDTYAELKCNGWGGGVSRVKWIWWWWESLKPGSKEDETRIIVIKSLLKREKVSIETRIIEIKSLLKLGSQRKVFIEIRIIKIRRLMWSTFRRWVIVVVYVGEGGWSWFWASLVSIIFHFHFWSDGMRCCGSDWPGLCLFVVINTRVSANGVDFGLFQRFHIFFNFTPLPPEDSSIYAEGEYGQFSFTFKLGSVGDFTLTLVFFDENYVYDLGRWSVLSLNFVNQHIQGLG